MKTWPSLRCVAGAWRLQTHPLCPAEAPKTGSHPLSALGTLVHGRGPGRRRLVEQSSASEQEAKTHSKSTKYLRGRSSAQICGRARLSAWALQLCLDVRYRYELTGDSTASHPTPNRLFGFPL